MRNGKNTANKYQYKQQQSQLRLKRNLRCL